MNKLLSRQEGHVKFLSEGLRCQSDYLQSDTFFSRADLLEDPESASSFMRLLRVNSGELFSLDFGG